MDVASRILEIVEPSERRGRRWCCLLVTNLIGFLVDKSGRHLGSRSPWGFIISLLVTLLATKSSPPPLGPELGRWTTLGTVTCLLYLTAFPVSKLLANVAGTTTLAAPKTVFWRSW